MRARRFLTAAILVFSAAPLWGDEAADAFNRLYGSDYNKAVMTPRDTAGAAALVAKLLDAAKTKGTDPGLVALLCDKAYELGSKAPGGYATAAQAMEFLADQAPDRRVECLDKATALRPRAYEMAKNPDKAKVGQELFETLLAAADAKTEAHATADAIGLCRRGMLLLGAVGQERKPAVQGRLERLLARQRVEKQVGNLKAKIQASPDDAATRNDLVRLCLVELDEPVQAATFLDDSCDESMRKYIPAVAKGVEDAPELACVELGNWYLGLADKAGPAGKGAMLARAYAYYDRFLTLHKTEDGARSEALLARQKVEEALAKLGEARADAPGPWVDLLRLADPARHAIEGAWELTPGGLSIKDGWGRFAFPCVPEGSYEVAFVMNRVGGNGGAGIVLPVGSTGLFFNFDPGGGRFDGAKPGQPAVELLSPGAVVTGKDFGFDIRVVQRKDQAEIRINLNDKPYLHWQGPVSDLSVSDRAKWLEPLRVSLGTNWSHFVFKSVRIRTLSGKLRMLK
jgi:hypothetical protein